jgi:CheY-like chemotaxis protein
MRRTSVADGDLHVGQAVHVWLKQHGFRVSTADSGARGLAALDNATFDLMIVDVFLPNMRGVEAIRLARLVPREGCRGDAFPHPKLRRSSTAAKRNAVGVAIQEGDRRAARCGL